MTMEGDKEWTALVQQAAEDVTGPAVIAALVIGGIAWVGSQFAPQHTPRFAGMGVIAALVVFLLLLVGRLIQLL